MEITSISRIPTVNRRKPIGFVSWRGWEVIRSGIAVDYAVKRRRDKLSSGIGLVFIFAPPAYNAVYEPNAHTVIDPRSVFGWIRRTAVLAVDECEIELL